MTNKVFSFRVRLGRCGWGNDTVDDLTVRRLGYFSVIWKQADVFDQVTQMRDLLERKVREYESALAEARYALADTMKHVPVRLPSGK